jgi:type IV secretory pathway TraG/TraD family ATPase VirD4
MMAIFCVLAVAVAYVVRKLIWLVSSIRRRREFRWHRLGFASPYEVHRFHSARAVVKKAATVRPSMRGRRNVAPNEVGYLVGRDARSRERIYGSSEQMMVVVGPPRQGKDAHFVTSLTIDAPGPCVVASTRLGAFTTTYTARSEIGQVYVFDPANMTAWPHRIRWSPLRGCENPIVATGRAAALVLGAGLELNASGGHVVGTYNIMRGYLHAAAIGGRTFRDVVRWAHDPADPEPVEILRAGEASGHTALGWASALEAVTVNASPAMAGQMLADLTVVLNVFSDPAVLDAVSPPPDELFDLREFLSGPNTLYVLGREANEGRLAPLVTALMEDILDTTRGIAVTMPNSRLDPPLTVELNDAAQITPMPNLPLYMGDSGGYSIVLHVYLQSLAQAKDKWGDAGAMAIWDNAAIRIVMGGGGNASDLEELSRLVGEFREKRHTVSSGNNGSQTVARSEATRRVLTSEEIRILEFGSAVMVSGTTRPVEVRLRPWWKRKDAKKIEAGKAHVEELIRHYAAQPAPHEGQLPVRPTFGNGQ